MHEFPEVQAIVRRACDQAPSGAHIARITIIVGEASGHDPEHIRHHFVDASRGTIAEGAELHFVHEKISARCASCGKEFACNDLALSCSQCGGTELVIVAGNSVRLSSVEY